MMNQSVTEIEPKIWDGVIERIEEMRLSHNAETAVLVVADENDDAVFIVVPQEGISEELAAATNITRIGFVLIPSFAMGPGLSLFYPITSNWIGQEAAITGLIKAACEMVGLDIHFTGTLQHDAGNAN